MNTTYGPCLPTRPKIFNDRREYKNRRESTAWLEPQRKSFFSAEKVGAAGVLQIEFLSSHEQRESKVRRLKFTFHRRRPDRGCPYGMSGRTSFSTIKLQKQGRTTFEFYVEEKSCPSAVGGGLNVIGVTQ